MSNMIRRGTILFFVVVLFATVVNNKNALMAPPSTAGSSDMEVWGSHAYCWANETIFDLIWKTYGGDKWYPVTVIVGVDTSVLPNGVTKGVDNLNVLFANAVANNRHLYPIIRLAAQGGPDCWSKIDPEAAANMLKAAVIPDKIPKPIYVSFGNEPHMANEWDCMSDPSPDYGEAFRRFAALMAGDSRYVVGHGAVNLSFPPGEEGEVGWPIGTTEGPGDRAERFYSSVAGKGAGSLSASKVLFSNPYELTPPYSNPIAFPDDPGIPGNNYGVGEVLSIPNHIRIDRHYNSRQGGANTPNIWMEFGAAPWATLQQRMDFLADAYRRYQSGDYAGLGPKAITPMLIEAQKNIVIYKKGYGPVYVGCDPESRNCGDEICNGGSARNNPPVPPTVSDTIVDVANPTGADEEGPPCNPGSIKLKIKGTIKSTRLFTKDPLDPDKYIRVPDQASTNPNPRDYPIFTNLKVGGAVVAVYSSQKTPNPSGPLPPGVKMLNFTGKKDGKIVGKLKEERTEANGLFEIETSLTCEEVWDGIKDGWKQYLAVFCPDNPDGAGGRLMLKDLYAIHLRPADGTNPELDFRDINVDCDSNTGIHGVFSAPNSLNYVVRNREQFLACSGSKELTDSFPTINYSHRAGDHRLKFSDEHSERDTSNPSSTPFDNWLSDLIERIRNALLSLIFDKLLGGNLPFNGRTEGRLSLQRVMCDTRRIYTLAPAFFRGLKEGFVHLPRYYLNGAPSGVETYNGYEEKPKLYKCEMLRRANMAIGEEGYEDFNIQTAGGFYNNLAAPYGGIVRKQDGSIDPYLSGDAARYLAANKSKDPNKGLPICIDENGETRYLGDFMPPEGFCGDLDNSGSLSGDSISDILRRGINGGEMPCPERFNCGDYNGDGQVKSEDGEISCDEVRVQNDDLSGYGRPGFYKFDVRYFPYFALDVRFTRQRNADINYRFFENNDDKSDWCGRGVDEGGWFNKDEDSSGKSRPDTRGVNCHGGGPTSQAFLGQLSVRKPSWFFLTYFALSPDVIPMFPHSMIVSPPQFIDSTDSAEIVKRSVELARRSVKKRNVAAPSRIGFLDQLCTCSLVEDGTNSPDSGLGNCFQDAQAIGGTAPEVKSPLNDFDSRQDYKLPGEGGNYDFDPVKGPNKVAADYDWSKRQLTRTIMDERGEVNRDPGDREKDKHYEQDTAFNVVEDVIRPIVEFFKCTGLSGSENNGLHYGNIMCSRTISMIGKASTWTPFRVKTDFSENWFTVGEMLTHPFSMIPDIDAVCEEDSTYTKAEVIDPFLRDSPDSKGREAYEAESFENSFSYLTNSVKPPSFEGDYTLSCTRIPGWQVTERSVREPRARFLSVKCTPDAGSCWVSGIGYSGNPGVILHSSDKGLNWMTEYSSNSFFVHGLDFEGDEAIGVGEVGRIYNRVGTSWVFNRGYPVKFFNPAYDYKGYLYDVAKSPKGYIATGTGFVFYSRTGIGTWVAIADPDTPPPPPACMRGDDYSACAGHVIGCADRDYPYGCVEKAFSEEYPDPGNNCRVGSEPAYLPKCCGDPGQPKCCCAGVGETPGLLNPRCPDGVQGGNARPCWIWGESSIWAVDCNTNGDCIIAGQRSPKVWWSTADKDYSSMKNWTLVEAGGLPGIPGDNHNLDVSYPDSNIAYVVGGSDTDIGGERGHVLKTSDKGRTWTTLIRPNEGKPDFSGIDCFDANNCAVVGNKATVLITEDGGATWKDWSQVWGGDPMIQEAKDKGVIFVDVAYPDKDTLIIVGFSPSESKAVIYALGEREVCGGDNLSCPSGSSVSCPIQGGGTITWDVSNTTACESAQPINTPLEIPGASEFVVISGTVQFRDPRTYGTENFVVDACTIDAGMSCYGFMNGTPMIYVKYGGQEYKFKFDRSLYQDCAAAPGQGYAVNTLKYSIPVPKGSQVAVRIADGDCGEVQPCLSDTTIVRSPWDKWQKGNNLNWYTANSNGCFNAIAWSQLARGRPPFAICGISVDCPNSMGCDGDREGSGNCFADKKGYPVGFKPCSDLRL